MRTVAVAISVAISVSMSVAVAREAARFLGNRGQDWNVEFG